MPMGSEIKAANLVPGWIPVEVRRYLAHTNEGQSIRSLAREAGCHASTVLRQVRRYETRRDDLLVDLALARLGGEECQCSAALPEFEDDETMTKAAPATDFLLPDEDTIRTEAPRILRRLNEPGAQMAIAKDMEKAVIVRDDGSGQALRTAVIERQLAEAMALKDWVCLASDGRIARYRISATGRIALKRFLAEDEAKRAGLAEEAAQFHAQHGEPDAQQRAKGKRKRIRYNTGESPLQILSRRRDLDGRPFLGPDLVAAGERLREDFELAQIGPRVTQNWDKFLTAGARSGRKGSCEGEGSQAARARVQAALSDLGPGLGDVVLRCCCFLEGIEATERRMGWSARSGKIVLRIALTRLKRHYDESLGNWSPLIG